MCLYESLDIRAAAQHIGRERAAEVTPVARADLDGVGGRRFVLVVSDCYGGGFLTA